MDSQKKLEIDEALELIANNKHNVVIERLRHVVDEYVRESGTKPTELADGWSEYHHRVSIGYEALVNAVRHHLSPNVSDIEAWLYTIVRNAIRRELAKPRFVSGHRDRIQRVRKAHEMHFNFSDEEIASHLNVTVETVREYLAESPVTEQSLNPYVYDSGDRYGYDEVLVENSRRLQDQFLCGVESPTPTPQQPRILTRARQAHEMRFNYTRIEIAWYFCEPIHVIEEWLDPKNFDHKTLGGVAEYDFALTPTNSEWCEILESYEVLKLLPGLILDSLWNHGESITLGPCSWDSICGVTDHEIETTLAQLQRHYCRKLNYRNPGWKARSGKRITILKNRQSA
ncbi:hypothetical protein ACFL2H_10585 [Planctomycetota bacterium]